MTRYVYISDSYLAHHGIKGMKWGKRNGPPYPLDASDKSAAERKAEGSAPNKKKIDEEKMKKIKKGVAIGAGVAATAGLTAGAIYLAKHPQAARAAVQGIKDLAINKIGSIKSSKAIKSIKDSDIVKRSLENLKASNKQKTSNIFKNIKEAHRSDQKNNLFKKAEKKGILSSETIENLQKLENEVRRSPEKLAANRSSIIDTHGPDTFNDLGKKLITDKHIKNSVTKIAQEAKANKGIRKAIKKAWVPVTATVGAAGTVAGTVGKLNNSINTVGAAANNPYVKKVYNKTKKNK